MLFSSMTFLFVFLPVVCTIYLCSKKEIRNYILLIASFVFYAWNEPKYLAIMILTILINYSGAIFIDAAKSEIKRKSVLMFNILLNLSFLVYFKYFNFVIDNFNKIAGADFSFLDIIMPIGISFYTFQGLSYLVDVYRREVRAQRDLCNLALYISLFPPLIAGPIIKYHDICREIENRESRFDNVVLGIKRFIMGLAKKVLIANTMAVLADNIFALPVERIDMAAAWLGAIAYSLQLYFDFSGYSDMAIGLGWIFGFKIMENFNYPYISKSITEFWRRWHISLSTWFKEYLYIPLGGNRVSPARMYVNLFIVFLATGIWHGASWTFIIWGIWHGFFIILEKASGWNKEREGAFINLSKHIYAILVFVIGWVLFRADTLAYAVEFTGRMFGSGLGQSIQNEIVMVKKDIYTMIAGLLISAPLFRNILYVPYERKILRTSINVYLFALLFLSSISIASSTYNPFIYFRF